MNNQRRKTINEICSELREFNLRLIDSETVFATLYDIKAKIETVYEEEDEYFYQMPHNLRSSKKGRASEEAKKLLETAIDNLDYIIRNIEDFRLVTTHLHNASEV